MITEIENSIAQNILMNNFQIQFLCVINPKFPSKNLRSMMKV